MKKHITLLALLLVCASAMARPVSVKDAQRVAKNFVMQYNQRAANLEPQLAYVHHMPNSNEPAMYVLNVGNAFVIVAANDVAHPVLGYSLSRPWPTASGERRAQSAESRVQNSEKNSPLSDLHSPISTHNSPLSSLNSPLLTPPPTGNGLPR